MKEESSFLIEGLEKWNIPIDDYKVEQFLKYMDKLLEWNKKFNLTSITEPKEIIVKHFIDSLALIKSTYLKETDYLLDLGTGAGFPGIPIKIMIPNQNIVLMDSLNKRIGFLKEVINYLNLSLIDAIHGRAEEIAHKADYRQKFDVVVSRAVAPLNILSEYCLPFVKVKGFFIAYKGPNVMDEIKEANHGIKILGAKVVDNINIEIPYYDIIHNLLVLEKVKETPKKYPRQAGKPKKSPL